jgi:hypothetical protein
MPRIPSGSWMQHPKSQSRTRTVALYSRPSWIPPPRPNRQIWRARIVRLLHYLLVDISYVLIWSIYFLGKWRELLPGLRSLSTTLLIHYAFASHSKKKIIQHIDTAVELELFLSFLDSIHAEITFTLLSPLLLLFGRQSAVSTYMYLCTLILLTSLLKFLLLCMHSSFQHP